MPGQPPLNLEQRHVARNVFQCVQLRAQLLARPQGASAADIMREYARHGLTSVVLVHGAGGTGKSAVHALAAEMCSAGLGELLITAYTGVAAAPFGGPTLLKLVGMRTQSCGERLPKFDADKAARLHEKFKAEYGTRKITDVGALVIDEVSFVPAQMLGHFEHRIRTLVATTRPDVGGADAELFGTLPVILSGDNWQLPPDCRPLLERHGTAACARTRCGMGCSSGAGTLRRRPGVSRCSKLRAVWTW